MGAPRPAALESNTGEHPLHTRRLQQNRKQPQSSLLRRFDLEHGKPQYERGLDTGFARRSDRSAMGLDNGLADRQTKPTPSGEPSS